MSNIQESSLRLPWWGRVFRGAMYAGFWISARLAFRVRVLGRDRLANLPGTIYLTLHKRDTDGIVALGTVFWACGGRGAVGRSATMCGEHVYLPGFVAGYVIRRPRWLSFLLFPIRVGGLMRAIGWYPMALARRRFLMAHLLDVLEVVGDRPVAEVLGENAAIAIPGAPVRALVSDILRWPYRDALFTLREIPEFVPAVAQRLWDRHKQRLAEYLHRFMPVLDTGGAIFMAPEGILSPDGRAGRIRSGLFRLIQQTVCDVNLQFMAMTYDFAAAGRTTVFLHVGPAVRDAKQWTQDELASWIRDTARRLTVITVGYLAAVTLRDAAKDGRTTIAVSELAECINQGARRYADEGSTVDPRLLDPRLFQHRWRAFLAYCARNGMLDTGRKHILVREEDFVPRTSKDFAALSPWQYCLNEIDGLADLQTRPELPRK